MLLLGGGGERRQRAEPEVASGAELGLELLDGGLGLGTHPQCRCLRRRPGLGLGHRELAGRFVEGRPDHPVGLEQSFPSRPQLFQLLVGGLPPAGEILQHPLAHRLGLSHHLAALGLGSFELLLGPAVGLGGDLGRHLLGLLAPAGEERFRLLLGPAALTAGLPHHPGDLLLGAGADIPSRLSGGVQDPSGLLAERRFDLLVGERP